MISRTPCTDLWSPQSVKFSCRHQMSHYTLHFCAEPTNKKWALHYNLKCICLKSCSDKCQWIEETSDSEGRHHGEGKELLLVEHLPLNDCEVVDRFDSRHGPRYLHGIRVLVNFQVSHPEVTCGHIICFTGLSLKYNARFRQLSSNI